MKKSILLSALSTLWLTAWTTQAFGVLPRSHHQPHRGASFHTQLAAVPGSSSLKPAALPLMDAGKALARSGEFLIDYTSEADLYGGALSAAGAQIRNAGDSVAQAAASCRFKTGAELVTDELREAAVCLAQAAQKCQQAAEEARVDEWEQLSEIMDLAFPTLQQCSDALESAGAGILMRETVVTIGQRLEGASAHLQTLSQLVLELSSTSNNARMSSQRMQYGAERMALAGRELQGIQPAPATGKSWLKGL